LFCQQDDHFTYLIHPRVVWIIRLSMATSHSTTDKGASPAVAAPALFILRFEGLAVASVSAVLYARTGASWWLFAALWLTPDLSILGYLAGPCWGARTYNAIHAYFTPAILALAALLLHHPGLLPFALIWVNHIGVDRLLGYGLKYPAGFGWTHLGGPGGRRGQVTSASHSLV
jgi:hypothetical protein